MNISVLGRNTRTSYSKVWDPLFCGKNNLYCYCPCMVLLCCYEWTGSSYYAIYVYSGRKNYNSSVERNKGMWDIHWVRREAREARGGSELREPCRRANAGFELIAERGRCLSAQSTDQLSFWFSWPWCFSCLCHSPFRLPVRMRTWWSQQRASTLPSYLLTVSQNSSCHAFQPRIPVKPGRSLHIQQRDGRVPVVRDDDECRGDPSILLLSMSVPFETSMIYFHSSSLEKEKVCLVENKMAQLSKLQVLPPFVQDYGRCWGPKGRQEQRGQDGSVLLQEVLLPGWRCCALKGLQRALGPSYGRKCLGLLLLKAERGSPQTECRRWITSAFKHWLYGWSLIPKTNG